MRGARRWAAVAAGAVALFAAVLALALSASPAAAFEEWAHGGANCGSCHPTPTDADCINCHTGYKSFPGENCWSCHAPGQDTSTLSSPSSACSQECHLWNPALKAYTKPTTHGTNPHVGSTPQCLDCHAMSVSISNPGPSPHHSGQATGFTDCGACHGSYQKHAGKLTCTNCHTTAASFHLYTASSPGFKKCRSCHAMGHARTKVPNSKCAACHKGTAGGGAKVAQHSRTITKKYVCGACHSKKLHASAVSHAVKNCRTCHAGSYHAVQRAPSKSVCRRCHSVALRHDNGFSCTLCHRSALHNPRPRAVNF